MNLASTLKPISGFCFLFELCLNPEYFNMAEWSYAHDGRRVLNILIVINIYRSSKLQSVWHLRYSACGENNWRLFNGKNWLFISFSCQIYDNVCIIMGVSWYFISSLKLISHQVWQLQWFYQSNQQFHLPVHFIVQLFLSFILSKHSSLFFKIPGIMVVI